MCGFSRMVASIHLSGDTDENGRRMVRGGSGMCAKRDAIDFIRFVFSDTSRATKDAVEYAIQKSKRGV